MRETSLAYIFVKRPWEVCIFASFGLIVPPFMEARTSDACDGTQGEIDMTAKTERAVLAGGCFWGVQDLLRRYPGVMSTRVGYTGGEVANATYRNHGNHAEGIEIIFDPQIISYRKLLEFFFQILRSLHVEPSGQRPRSELPVGDLLYQ